MGQCLRQILQTFWLPGAYSFDFLLGSQLINLLLKKSRKKNDKNYLGQERMAPV